MWRLPALALTLLSGSLLFGLLILAFGLLFESNSSERVLVPAEYFVFGLLACALACGFYAGGRMRQRRR